MTKRELTMPKSIELLLNEESKNLLNLICDTNCGVEKMSNFEVFSFACENLAKLSGNAFRARFLTLLKEDLNEDVTVAFLADREVQKTLWKRMFDPFCECYKSLSMSSVEKCKIDGAKLLKICNTSKDSKNKKDFLNLNLIAEPENLRRYKTLDYIINSLVNNRLGNSKTRVFVDMTKLSFVRPDQYNSSLAYEKISSGENYNNLELSQLILWLLASISKRVDSEIILRVDNNGIGDVESVISMLKTLKIKIDLKLCFDIERCDLASFCVQKNISSEIIISEEIDEITIKQYLKRIIYILPIARISFCKELTVENGAERFCLALSSLLRETCESENEAEECVKAVLG